MTLDQLTLQQPLSHDAQEMDHPNRGQVARTGAQVPRVAQPMELLPYHVLLDIFNYASQSSNEALEHHRDAHWLLNAARTCKSLCEPALTALYQSPPLHTVPSSRRLLYTLQQDPANMICNYRNKVQRLEMPLAQTLSIARATHLTFDLPRLVSLTPNLRHLWLIVPPVAWDRWSYPEELFVSLSQSGVRLRSWRWESRLVRANILRLTRYIHLVHEMPAFQSLVHLSLVDHPMAILSPSVPLDSEPLEYIAGPHLPATPPNENADPSTSEDAGMSSGGDSHDNNSPSEVESEGLETIVESEGDDPDVAECIELANAMAVAVLPRLESLHFERCDLVKEALLARLPRGLTMLSIVDCGNLKFEELELFLRSHGRTLRQLKIRSRRSMRPVLLNQLAEWCPELQVLSLCCKYNDPPWLQRRPRPPYTDGGLEAFVPPGWPSTLQHLELNNFHIATIATATAFFDALVRAGPTLPHLRNLAVKVIVEGEWRARATFRELWTPLIKRVFKRRSQPPSEALMSMANWRAYKMRMQSKLKRKREIDKNGGDMTMQQGNEGTKVNHRGNGWRQSSPLFSRRAAARAAANVGEGPSRPAEPKPEPAPQAPYNLPMPKRRKTELERLLESAGCDRPSLQFDEDQDNDKGDEDECRDEDWFQIQPAGSLPRAQEQAIFGNFSNDMAEARAGYYEGKGKGKARAIVFHRNMEYQEAALKREESERFKRDEAEMIKRESERLKREAEKEKRKKKYIPSVEEKFSAEYKNVFVQGMCDEVEIRIDNNRPMEQLYTEADFLGSEISGDEDWDGHDYDNDEDAALAW
ncbi:MAG: hypothetical protein M1823_003426 [Watsoniomyces obsoletus]|nr:MAG: hypothetical protein M1823_003426 [Watsoniomyces obsoletus]